MGYVLHYTLSLSRLPRRWSSPPLFAIIHRRCRFFFFFFSLLCSLSVLHSWYRVAACAAAAAAAQRAQEFFEPGEKKREGGLCYRDRPIGETCFPSPSFSFFLFFLIIFLFFFSFFLLFPLRSLFFFLIPGPAFASAVHSTWFPIPRQTTRRPARWRRGCSSQGWFLLLSSLCRLPSFLAFVNFWLASKIVDQRWTQQHCRYEWFIQTFF